MPLPQLRSDVLAIARAAIDAVDARVCVPQAMTGLHDALVRARRWHVLAAGKAAGPMLRAALGAASRPPASALCIAPAEPDGLPREVAVCLGGHPTPTAGSVEAGARALQMADACATDDLFVILLSGGASALMAAPAPGLTLGAKQAATRILLRAGADITALNTVRKHLSCLKGGRLARRSAAPVVCLAISDVVGDDLSVIASGPTVPDGSTFRDALDVIDRCGGRDTFPRDVVAWLEHGDRTGDGESPKPGTDALVHATTRVIASQRDAVRGAADEARRRGYAVATIAEAVVGEARLAALRYRDAALAVVPHVPRACVISAGETTVTVTGSGRGGRNQEFAVAASAWLGGLGGNAVLASLGTDGIDGPTDAAGAIVDGTTLARARAASLAPPEDVLRANDSCPWLTAVGDVLVTGPTGTNVGDVQVLLLDRETPS